MLNMSLLGQVTIDRDGDPPPRFRSQSELALLIYLAHTSCWRLGELAFLVGNILTWLAALLPPQPTGFWDRRPKKRLAGYAGSWLRLFFQKSPFLTGNFEKSGRQPTIYRRELRPIGGLDAR